MSPQISSKINVKHKTKFCHNLVFCDNVEHITKLRSFTLPSSLRHKLWQAVYISLAVVHMSMSVGDARNSKN